MRLSSLKDIQQCVYSFCVFTRPRHLYYTVILKTTPVSETGLTLGTSEDQHGCFCGVSEQ